MKNYFKLQALHFTSHGRVLCLHTSSRSVQLLAAVRCACWWSAGMPFK